MVFDQFCGPAYEVQSQIAAGERCVNWYPKRLQRGGKTQLALVPCPGFSSFATLSDMPGRGIFAENGRCFVVAGTTLYELDSAGTPTSRGTVASDTNPATMCMNGEGGDELFITSGDEGYVLDLNTNTLTNPVSDVTFGGQLDGFFVALDQASSTMKISESLDGSTWDATQIAQRTSASDSWQAMIVVRREIILLGNRTGEVWYNSGASPFPFERRGDAFFEVGIDAPFSLARFGNTIAWLGRSALGSGRVYWLNGYTPEPISTPGVEWAIQEYKAAGVIDDAIGWSYESEGNLFYVLEFPTAGRTWVYDASTRMWHERGAWSPADNDFTPYRARFHVQMFRKNLVCDNDGSIVYDLSPTTYTDAGGNPLRRLRRSPHMAQQNRHNRFPWFELEVERGVGLTSGQGSDPEIFLRYSNDGGKTWGSSRTRGLGKIGEYDARVRWDRCGSGRDRVWEVWISDPVYAAIVNCYVGAAPSRYADA